MPSSRRERDSSSLSAPMSTSSAVPAASPLRVRKLMSTAPTSNAVTAPNTKRIPLRSRGAGSRPLATPSRQIAQAAAMAMVHGGA
jgi:hypothetical protein